MFNNISDFLKNESYRISIIPTGIHILNYKNIIDISSNKVLISFKDKNIDIKGSNLRLIKLDKYELLISGNIERISLNE